ncbi:proline iminopeptidase [Mycena epipterygia]|nr:proline iminopeptidase [Mycena epipterygia]
MSPTNLSPEGTIPFVVDGETCETWYKIFRDLSNRTQPPLTGLHDEPGMAHDYLVPQENLSATRAVILYDQIGNSRSTHLPGKSQSFWTIDLFFIDELANLITGKHFELEGGFYLLGHSWGGILAVEASFSDSLADMGLWIKSNMELMSKFPENVQAGLESGFGALKKYREALEFYQVHAYRISPLETGEGGDPTSSLAMNGGALKGWSIVDRLHQVKVPCLVINGKWDLSQDYVVKPFFDKITLENSSHLPMWEERERYTQIVEEFMAY